MRARSLRSAIGIAFITGRPKRARTAATRSGVSTPCNCSMSGLSASTTAASVCVVGIDGERDLAGAAFDAPAERARGREPEMARTRREEHEADQVGVGFQRHIKRFRGLQPANFDQERHGRGSSSLRPLPAKRNA